MAADIEVSVESQIADLYRDMAAANKEAAHLQKRLAALAQQGEDSGEAATSLKRELAAVKRESAAAQTEISSLKAVLSAVKMDKAAQDAAKMAASVETVTVEVRKATAMVQDYTAATAKAAAGKNPFAAQAHDARELTLTLSDLQREARDLESSIKEGMSLGQSSEGIMSMRISLSKLRDDIQKTTAALNAANTQTASKGIFDARSTIAATNSLSLMKGEADEVTQRILAQGAAFDKTAADADRYALSLRKIENTALTQILRGQLSALNDQLRVMDSSSEGVEEMAKRAADLKAQITALTSESNQLTTALNKIGVESRKVAQDQAAAATATAASIRAGTDAMNETLDSAAKVEASVLKVNQANIALQDSEYNLEQQREQATKAAKIQADVLRREGADSIQAVKAKRQYAESMRDLDSAFSKTAKAQAALDRAIESMNEEINQAGLASQHLNQIMAAGEDYMTRHAAQVNQVADSYNHMRREAKGAGLAVPDDKIWRGMQGKALNPLTDAEGFSRSAGIYERGFGAINTQLGKLLTTVSFMRIQLHALVATVGAFLALDLVTRVDQSNKALAAGTMTLGDAAKSTRDLAQAQQFLLGISGDYQQRVTDLTSSYILLTKSTTAANIPLEQAQAAFEGVVAASKVLGKSNEDTTASLQALSQIASKGVVSMEELRQQLGERLPGVMDILAKGLTNVRGELVTTADVMKEIASGNLKADEFFKAFGPELLNQFGEAAKSVKSLSGAINLLKQAMDTAVTAANTGGLSDGFADIALALADILKSKPVLVVLQSIGSAVQTMGTMFSSWVASVNSSGGIFVYFKGLATAFGAAMEAAKAAFYVFANMFNMLNDFLNLEPVVGILYGIGKGFAILADNADILTIALTALAVRWAILNIGTWASALVQAAKSFLVFIGAAEGAGAAITVMGGPLVWLAATIMGVVLAVTAFHSAMSDTEEALDITAVVQASTSALDAYAKAAADVKDEAVSLISARNELQQATESGSAAEIQAARGSVKSAEDQIAALKKVTEQRRVDLQLQANQLEMAIRQTAQQADAIRLAETARSSVATSPDDFNSDPNAASRAADEGAKSVAEYRKQLEGLINTGHVLSAAQQEWWDKDREIQNDTDVLKAMNVALADSAEKFKGLGHAPFLSDTSNQIKTLTDGAKELKDSIAQAEAGQAAFAKGGTAAYEAFVKTTAKAEDLRSIMKTMSKGADDTDTAMQAVAKAADEANASLVSTVQAMADGGNEAAQLAIEAWNAKAAADATAASAASVANMLANAVAYAKSLRAQLGSSAISANYGRQEVALLLQKAEAIKAGNKQEAIALDGQIAALPIREQMTQTTFEVTNALAEQTAAVVTSGASWSQMGTALKTYWAGAQAQLGAARETAAVALEVADAQNQVALATNAASAAGAKGGGGGKYSDKAEDARDLAEALKLLTQATKDARGEQESMSQEAIDLGTAINVVDAAVKAGKVDISRWAVSMDLVRKRMAQLAYGAVDLGATITDSLSQGFSSAADAMADFFAGGMKNMDDFTKAMTDAFNQMLRDILRAIIQNEIVVPITMGMKGDSGGGLLGMLGGALKTGLSSFGDSFSGSLGSILKGDFTDALSGVTDLASGAATGLSGIAGALGSLAGPLAIAGVLFSAFQTKTTILAQGLQLSLRGMDASIESFQKIEKSKLWGLIKDRSTKTGSAGSAGNEIIDKLGSMFDAIRDSASVLGLATDAFDGFFAVAHDFKVNLDGLSSDEASAKIERWMSDIASQMVDFGLGAMSLSDALKEVAIEGETSYDTFLRMATSLTTVNNVLATFSKLKLPKDFAGGAAAAMLTDLFGGVENFVSAMANYTSIFYSSYEQGMIAQAGLQQKADALNKTFSDLNLTLPKSGDELKAMVDALDLTTASGRAAFEFLTNNASAFKQWFDAMAAGTEEMQKLDKRRSDILAELTNRYDAMIAAEKMLAAARDSLLASDQAPGTELDQYRIMQQQYQDTLAKAKAGDMDAINALPQMGRDLLDQAYLVYGASEKYAKIFDGVSKDLLDVGALLKDSADTVKGQLDSETFTDVTRQSTQQLLDELAAINASIAALKDPTAQANAAAQASAAATTAATTAAAPAATAAAYSAVIPDADSTSAAMKSAQDLLGKALDILGPGAAYAKVFADVNRSIQRASSPTGGKVTGLDGSTFKDVSKWSTNALLNALASLDDRLEAIRQQQEDQASRAQKQAQNRSTGRKKS